MRLRMRVGSAVRSEDRRPAQRVRSRFNVNNLALIAAAAALADSEFVRKATKSTVRE